MTDRKAQHQARAQLVREGTRTLGAAAITDYRAAKPTHKPKPAQTMTVTAADGTTATIEVTDVKVRAAIRDGQVHAYSMARDYEGSVITAVAPSDPDSLTRQLDALVDDLTAEGLPSPSRGRSEVGAAIKEGMAEGMARGQVLWTRSEGSEDLTTITMMELDEVVEAIWGSDPAPDGYPNAYATATTYAEAIAHATTPKPLPSPDTREGLLARLNARHQH